MRKETARWFAVLAAVPFVMVLGNSMLVPVLPTIGRRLHLDPVEVGFIITAFSLPAGLTIPLAGMLSDRFGRKAVMVPALVLYGLGGILAGLSAWLLPGQFWPILASRAVQGVGAGGTYQLAMALAGDVFQSQERTRAMGLLEASNGLGKVVSPLLGSLAAMVIWFLPFFVYGLVALPTAGGVYLAVQEPGERPSTGSLKEYWRQLKGVAGQRGPTLGASYGAGLVALFSLFGVLSYLSDRLERDAGLGELARGAVIAIPVAVMAVTAYLGGLYLQRRPQALKALALTGLGLAAVALGVLAWPARSPTVLVAAASGLGLGVGAVLPAVNTAITSSAARSQRGVVTSLYGTVRFGGVAAGPPLFGLAHEAPGRVAVFGGAALLAALAAWAVASVALARPQHHPPRQAAPQPQGAGSEG